MVWKMADVENYNPQQFWNKNQKENANCDAEMRQEDEVEDWYMRFKVRSIRDKRTVLVMLTQPTNVLSLRL